MSQAPNPFEASRVDDPGKPIVDEENPEYVALNVRALQTRGVLLLLAVAYPGLGAFSYFTSGSLAILIVSLILGGIYFALRALCERAPFAAPLIATILFSIQLLAALLTISIMQLIIAGAIFGLLVRGTSIGYRIRRFRTGDA